MKVRVGRNFNMGNYESQRIELESENVKEEDIEQTYKKLLQRVHQLKNIKVVTEMVAKEKYLKEVNKEYHVKEIGKWKKLNWTGLKKQYLEVLNICFYQNYTLLIEKKGEEGKKAYKELGGGIDEQKINGGFYMHIYRTYYFPE